MKKHFIYSLIIVSTLCACQITSTKNKTERPSLSTIESIADDFFIALGTGDTTLMQQILSDNFQMFEHDEIWNVDSLLSLMPNTIGRKWSIEDLEISQSDDLVHIYYFNNSINPIGRSWYESMLLTPSEGRWKIKFMHSTKLYLK